MMNENEFSDCEDEYSDELPAEEVLSTFTLLENDYKNVLAQMQDNEELAAFGNEYAKLFETFTATYNNEQELMNKCASLSETIAQNTEEFEKYEKNKQKHENIIEDLQVQLENAQRLTDNAHAREQQAQEVIENMRTQIMKLNTELELKSRMGSDQGDEMNKTKEGFEREKLKMMDEIQTLKQKLTNAINYSEELERKNSAADLRQQELNNIIEQHVSESAKTQRTLEKTEMDLKASAEENEVKIHEINKLQKLKENLEIQLEKLNKQLKDTALYLERIMKQNENWKIKNEKCVSDFNMITASLTKLQEKYSFVTKNLQLRESEVLQMKNDVIKLNKQREYFEKKLEITEKSKHNVEKDREKLRSTVEMMEREVFVSKKSNELDKRTIENMVREKEILNKNIVRAQGVLGEHIKLIKIQEQTQQKLESEITTMRREAGNQKREIFNMEKERNRVLEESLDLTQKVEDAMDEIKLKQQSIFELKKIIAETETRLRQQQNLFETVRADRNAFQKALQESIAECDQLKNKLGISNHQTEQLKEDIAAKESLLLKEENILKKLNKEKEGLKVEVQKGLDHVQTLKNDIFELKRNEKKLYKVINDNDLTIKTQDKELEQIMKDRDLIGAQLVRRNDEISLLYEKINILQITLHRGEAQYDQRLDDIRLLKIEIKRLRQEKNLLSKSIANMTDLKHEVFQLERELAEERLKCRALEEELQHPLNIHRWRKLEGSDPDVVELLQKIQILQKRLLKQTSQSLEREKQLKESERLYLNLRNVLARQPGPDVKTELCKTQRALMLRGNKMKCLISEMNMYETQVVEYKMDVDKLSSELKDVKKKYLREKKMNQRHLTAEPRTPVHENSAVVKFTGGGFKMAPATS